MIARVAISRSSRTPFPELKMIASAEKLAQVRSVYGRDIQTILSKESSHGILPVIGAIEILVGSKLYQKLAVSRCELMVFAFVWLAREVQNGGFDQYFFNSAGDYWREVIDGLQWIGDQKGLCAFREVLTIFPGASPSEQRHTRQEQLNLLEDLDEQKLTNHFKRADSYYYEYPYPKWDLVAAFIKMRQDEFRLETA